VPRSSSRRQTRSAWLAVGLIGVATACHQAWSANLFTLSSDMFPRGAVGTVVGFGGFMGGIGGILIAEFAGRVLQRDPSYYLPMFVIAGTDLSDRPRHHHLLAPRLERAELPEYV
jgi:ACS family hexuronate transporter-like MFS transporter